MPNVNVEDVTVDGGPPNFQTAFKLSGNGKELHVWMPFNSNTGFRLKRNGDEFTVDVDEMYFLRGKTRSK